MEIGTFIGLSTMTFADGIAKGGKVYTCEKFDHFDTIISPNITEKATSLSDLNKVVFKVHNGASKYSIKKSIEKLFKVNVIKINTINLKGKTKLVRGKKSTKPGFKKAIITLKKGQSIDLASGI